LTTTNVLLGTQGWNYPAWVGPFYPTGTRAVDMLGLYARAFRTVEVDSTFYAVPADPVVRGWVGRVPPEFVFSLKVPQAITHERRLVDTDEVLAHFLERVRPLGARLGALLVQLAPDFDASRGHRHRLAKFLERLPHDLRWAVEFRDARWLDEATHDLLTEHGIGLALADGRWVKRDLVLALMERPTADFVYLRWMGPNRRITDYSRIQVDREEEIDLWAIGMAALAPRVKTIYGYFNNHFQGHSPQSARELQRRLGQPVVEPAALRDQEELF